MVQPTLQQKCTNKRGKKNPVINRQTFPEKTQVTQDFQSKYHQSQL